MKDLNYCEIKNDSRHLGFIFFLLCLFVTPFDLALCQSRWEVEKKRVVKQHFVVK